MRKVEEVIRTQKQHNTITIQCIKLLKITFGDARNQCNSNLFPTQTPKHKSNPIINIISSPNE